MSGIIERISKAEKRIVDLYNKFSNLNFSEQPTTQEYASYVGYLVLDKNNPPYLYAVKEGILGLSVEFVNSTTVRIVFPEGTDFNNLWVSNLTFKSQNISVNADPGQPNFVTDAFPALQQLVSIDAGHGSFQQKYQVSVTGNYSTSVNHLIAIAEIEIKIFPSVIVPPPNPGGLLQIP